MVNGAVEMSSGARNFGLECRDARLKLLDRKRVKVITGKQIQRIARPTGQIFVGLHDPQR